MKKIFSFLFVASVLIAHSCNNAGTEDSLVASESVGTGAGQSAVQDDESQKDVVKVAVGSPDHTTLVAAVKQAGLVDALSNAGPFTVFAPVNAAFDKLPKGTVEDLMKPASKAKLQDILEYHVYVGNLRSDFMYDGQVLNQVNGGNITVSKSEDGKLVINNSANVIASIPAANGIIHVIDAVLLPDSK